jgi:hypothetical protein
MLEVFLMDEESATPSAIELPTDKAKNGRPTQYDEKLGAKIIDAVRAGFTLERAAEYIGINPATAQGWVSKRQDFGRLIKKARREHEMGLLRSVELAGEKSWQARAWILERTHGYFQPSARLQVSQDVTHGISGNLASLLAGIAGRKKEKKAEVIETQILPEPRMQIASASITSAHKSQIEYCIKSETLQPEALTPKTPRTKHKRMKLRKPRAESLAKYPPTTTPPANPPATI